MNGVSLPGWEFCLGISRALTVPPEAVLRRAGLLPPLPEETSEGHEILEIVNRQPAPVRRTLLSMLRGLAGQRVPVDHDSAEVLALYERLPAEWRPALLQNLKMFELNARGLGLHVIGEEDERERERLPSATE